MVDNLKLWMVLKVSTRTYAKERKACWHLPFAGIKIIANNIMPLLLGSVVLNFARWPATGGGWHWSSPTPVPVAVNANSRSRKLASKLRWIVPLKSRLRLQLRHFRWYSQRGIFLPSFIPLMGLVACCSVELQFNLLIQRGFGTRTSERALPTKEASKVW